MNDINFKYTGNFGETLTYMFKDPKWVSKVLLGALFGIIPIVNFVTGGYVLRVIDNIRADTDPHCRSGAGTSVSCGPAA